MNAHPEPNNQQQPNQQSLPVPPAADGIALTKKQMTALVGFLIALLTTGTVGGFSLGASKEEVSNLKVKVAILETNFLSIKNELEDLNDTLERVEGRLDRAIDGGP